MGKTATLGTSNGVSSNVSGKKPKKGTSNDPARATKSNGISRKAFNKEKSSNPLIFAPRPDWHAAELPSISPPAKDFGTPSRQLLEELQKHAISLLQAENSTYAATHLASSSSHKFLSTIMSSGTWEDKVSAQTLLVQESPLHTMKVLESLIGMAKKRSRNQALMALGALKDLLAQGVVLPADRKLRSFAKQPSLLFAIRGVNTKWVAGDPLPGGLEPIHLLIWAYEDWLKRSYFELLKILETWSNDEIEHSRIRAVTFVWELLKEKPEQEENLLRLLVNKLGDKEKKVASRASYLLLQLQTIHPNMKSIIINAIETDVLFRPGQNSHAMYYAIITLNQTMLSLKEQEVANKLLEIYFNLFLALLKQPDHATKPILEVKPALQGGGGKPGKKAAQKARLKERASKSEDEMKDKLIAQILVGVNRAFPYSKTDDVTFEQQMDTIFKITHSANFNTSIQALVLIQQISMSKHYSADRFYRTLYESLLDPRLLTSSKHTMYLNLLYRSLKADINAKRVQAFVKRILQILNLHEPPFISGALYLVSQLQQSFPSIKAMLSEAERNEEDEEERFVDVPDEPPSTVNGDTHHTAVHNQDNNSTAIKRSNAYDGRKRDPEHSNAHQSCLWELIPFLSHFHPTVSLYSLNILQSGSLDKEKPDPSLHTLIHFLDRFVYRNPKAPSTSKTRGTSIMQPLAGADTGDMLIKSRQLGRAKEAPVNREEFWQKKAEDVGVDEVFFHRYFERSGKGKEETRKDKKRKSRDADSDDEEGEEEIWKALVDSRPELEGDEEGDEDLDIDDWESDLDDDDANELELPDGTPELDISEAEKEEFDMPSEDEDAIVASDDDVPSDLEDVFEKELDPKSKEEDAGHKPKGKKRRKLKHLPTFASAEDYAKLLGDDDDEDV